MNNLKIEVARIDEDEVELTLSDDNSSIFSTSISLNPDKLEELIRKLEEVKYV